MTADKCGGPKSCASGRIQQKTRSWSQLCPSHWVTLGSSLSSLFSVSASVEPVVGSADLMLGLFFFLTSGTVSRQGVWVESIQEGSLEEVR